MQSFKRKKEDFDNIIETGQKNIKGSKKLYKTFKNLENIEKNKSEELINILFFLDEFYTKKSTYYEGIDNLKLSIANDVKLCQKKSLFYKNISKFYINVKSDLNPILQYKTRMYEFFELEYEYLNKRNLLEEKLKYMKSQQNNFSNDNILIRKIQSSIKDNENRLDKVTNDSNKFFSIFEENSEIYNHNKFKSVNPVVKKFIEMKYDYFEKLEIFYREAFKNRGKLVIKNRKFDNFADSEKKLLRQKMKNLKNEQIYNSGRNEEIYNNSLQNSNKKYPNVPEYEDNFKNINFSQEENKKKKNGKF